MALEFTAYGVPQQKGSMRAFAYPLKNRATGQPILDKGGKPMYGAAATSDNPSVKGWQQLLAEGANRALGEKPDDDRAVLQDGVRLTIAFYLPRPKKYQKRGVEPAHLVAPDLDKLVRAVLDALTHVVYRDDSQVVELVTSKHYAGVDDAPHARIRVEAIAGAAPAPTLAARALEPSLPLGF